MSKHFILAILIAITGVTVHAQQTMWIHTGHVHWAYNTETVGNMPYSSANLLTVLEKGFTLADVDSITVANETFADDNVLVKYSNTVADVYVAGNIANHITAQVTNARVAVIQDAGEPSEVDTRLAQLFDNVANKKDLDNTLYELSLCWELSTQETYNDYTDYAPEIGWNLAIGYLKDNNRKQAKATLQKLIEVAPEGTAIGDKAREVLMKI